jgi:hypothetical protein
MEPKEKVLNPEESLQIIEKMINRTKGNAHDNSFYFLLWGWIILIALVAQLIMKYFTDFTKVYMIWLIVIPGFIASGIYGYKQGKKAKTFSHFDKINSMVWLTFFVCYVLTIIFAKEFNYNIGFIIFLLAGNATFLSGIIIKFKPLIFGGIVFWLGALSMYIVPSTYAEFISPIVIIFAYLIPGYLLKLEKNNNA